MTHTHDAGGETMPHPSFDRLNDLVDGRLPAAEREAVERHAAACAACGRAVDGLRRLLAAADAAPRAVEPPPEVWTAVRGRMAERGVALRVRRAWWRRTPALAAAAAVLLVGSVALLATRAGDPSPRRAPTPQTAGMSADDRAAVDAFLDTLRVYERAELAERRERESGASRVVRNVLALLRGESANQPLHATTRVDLPVARQLFALDRAAHEVASAVDTAGAALPPAARAVLTRSLVVVDSAIAETRAALAQDPGNEAVAEALTAAQERRVELLLQATRILSDE